MSAFSYRLCRTASVSDVVNRVASIDCVDDNALVQVVQSGLLLSQMDR